jgi:hypothetical protein
VCSYIVVCGTEGVRLYTFRRLEELNSGWGNHSFGFLSGSARTCLNVTSAGWLLTGGFAVFSV